MVKNLTTSNQPLKGKTHGRNFWCSNMSTCDGGFYKKNCKISGSKILDVHYFKYSHIHFPNEGCGIRRDGDFLEMTGWGLGGSSMGFISSLLFTSLSDHYSPNRRHYCIYQVPTLQDNYNFNYLLVKRTRTNMPDDRNALLNCLYFFAVESVMVTKFANCILSTRWYKPTKHITYIN